MARPLLAAAAAALMMTMAGLASGQPVTSPPFPSAPMPTNNPQALANVRESKQYNTVMRSNPSFRQRRMQQECGPITDPQLHQECMASVEAYK